MSKQTLVEIAIKAIEALDYIETKRVLEAAESQLKRLAAERDRRIVIVYDELENGVRFKSIIYSDPAELEKVYPQERYQLVPNRREKKSRPR